MANICEIYGVRATVPVALPVKLAKNVDLQKGVPIKSEQMVGIEIEVEQTRANGIQLSAIWTTTDDGSLRNQGMEFVSKPIKACDTPVALAHLFHQYLTNECCYSPRTSVHVHLNAQDMNFEQLRCFMALYTIFERGFYKFVGRNRRNNIYCVPLAECRLLASVGTENPIRGWYKYTGVNLLPLSTQGTIEFRHMHGTPDVEKITRWIGIITKLKDFVMLSNVEELKHLLIGLDAKSDVVELARTVFGEFADYLPVNNDKNDVVASKLAFHDGRATNEVTAKVTKKSPFYTFK